MSFFKPEAENSDFKNTHVSVDKSQDWLKTL